MMAMKRTKGFEQIVKAAEAAEREGKEVLLQQQLVFMAAFDRLDNQSITGPRLLDVAFEAVRYKIFSSLREVTNKADQLEKKAGVAAYAYGDEPNYIMQAVRQRVSLLRYKYDINKI